MDLRELRVPDSIDPIVGFRCWYYSIVPGATSLFPLNFAHDTSGRSPWDGAHARWVVARCHHPARRRLRLVGACGCGAAAALGFPPDRCPVCTIVSHDAPDEACTCGFYALRVITPELIETAVARGPWATIGGTVMGRVLLAGKVIEHDLGYRAERARVAELIPVKGTEPSVMRLANRLRLPVGPAVEHA